MNWASRIFAIRLPRFQFVIAGRIHRDAVTVPALLKKGGSFVDSCARNAHRDRRRADLAYGVRVRVGGFALRRRNGQLGAAVAAVGRRVRTKARSRAKLAWTCQLVDSPW